MRIKRFTAPDMRTALRMVRDEQGPDAVILSTRTRADGAGIEVVAATDYDEALVAQALRAVAPAAEATPAPGPAQAAAAPASEAPAAPRDTLISRARAVFRIGEGPTLAELTSTPAPAAAAPRVAADAVIAAVAPAPAAATSAPSRFDAMMAALDPPRPAPAERGAPAAAAFEVEVEDFVSLLPQIPMPLRPGEAAAEPIAPPTAHAPAPAPAAVEALQPAAPVQAQGPAPAARPLQVVATPEADPAIVAMREEMARMRQMMETQMEQLSLERLRGSPARAAVLDALLACGCEEALAQAVAERIDPRLPPAEVQAPMLAELARMLPIVRNEPLEDGGVIALVGPTGAGKTTTAAKLAARFAARHRARDVALVTTDCQRPGAREQLQAHGRRLGITVCEAEGPERLQDALAQLVDYPLVLVDTTGHAPRDRAVFSQILWLRASRRVRSLLVLPANAHPHDLGEVIRRYRPAKPEGVVLTKLDEAGRPGAAFSVLARHGLGLAYTTRGQEVPSDIDAADATGLVQSLEKSRRAADNPLATEDHHAVA